MEKKKGNFLQEEQGVIQGMAESPYVREQVKRFPGCDASKYSPNTLQSTAALVALTGCTCQRYSGPGDDEKGKRNPCFQGILLVLPFIWLQR